MTTNKFADIILVNLNRLNAFVAHNFNIPRNRFILTTDVLSSGELMIHGQVNDRCFYKSRIYINDEYKVINDVEIDTRSRDSSITEFIEIDEIVSKCRKFIEFLVFIHEIPLYNGNSWSVVVPYNFHAK